MPRSILPLLLKPGQLREVGPAALVPGGVVSNTGLALQRLGFSAQLIGKVGDDLIGEALLDQLRQQGELVDGMVRAEGEPGAYTIVLGPPGMERIFFHCPGANRTFHPDEISRDDLADAPLFHCGYSPLMRQVYLDGGEQLARLFRDVREQGRAVSMDMTVPDPESESGQVDWAAWLTRVLPHVDLFAPSLEETLFMLERPLYDRVQEGEGGFAARMETETLDRIAGKLIERGVPLVVLKLGPQGRCLRTADDMDPFRQLEEGLSLSAGQWAGRQLLLPPFVTEVVGTTGAGDAAVAVLLAGVRRGLSPEETLWGAVAVGTCNVEAADSTSGIPSWASMQARLDRGGSNSRSRWVIPAGRGARSTPCGSDRRTRRLRCPRTEHGRSREEGIVLPKM